MRSFCTRVIFISCDCDTFDCWLTRDESRMPLLPSLHRRMSLVFFILLVAHNQSAIIQKVRSTLRFQAENVGVARMRLIYDMTSTTCP
jgi:hypothetical protein